MFLQPEGISELIPYRFFPAVAGRKQESSAVSQPLAPKSSSVVCGWIWMLWGKESRLFPLSIQLSLHGIPQHRLEKWEET